MVLTVVNDFDQFMDMFSPFYPMPIELIPIEQRRCQKMDRHCRQRQRLHRHQAPAQCVAPSEAPKEFQLSVDVQEFKPEEISVKTVNNSVVIEAKHEEREDEHGLISRQFVRKYTLPKDVDPNLVISSLSANGMLTITAPKPIADSPKERVVQIQHVPEPAQGMESTDKPEESVN